MQSCCAVPRAAVSMAQCQPSGGPKLGTHCTVGESATLSTHSGSLTYYSSYGKIYICSGLGGGGGMDQGVCHFLYGVSMGTSLPELLFLKSWVFTISLFKETSSFAFCLEKISED